MRCEDLNKELVEKMSIVSNLQDKIKSLENHIKNYKRSLKFLSEKNANQDTLEIESNAKNKKIEDLDEEIRNLHVEIM
jgi:predicted RNase H-like nuclease (RuvC/YqgF family)